MKREEFWQAVGVAAGVSVLLLIGFCSGWLLGFKATEEDRPVCYASTEDSSIVGCDYRNGAWYAE